MARTTQARHAAIETAWKLFRSQGYNGTGLKQILEESGSPKGSFYFHFPGGKTQLAVEALGDYSGRLAQRIRALHEVYPDNAEAFVRAMGKALTDECARRAFDFGCVVQNLANEVAPVLPEITAATRAAFETLTGAIAEGVQPAFGLAGDPQSKESAWQFSVAMMSAIGGARAIARAEQSCRAFEAITQVFADALAARSPPQVGAPGACRP